jgi:serine phosphatase RsbU (regulator of sigma subunit)
MNTRRTLRSPAVPAARTPVPPITEAERQRALRELSILDTPPEERFDRVVRLARRLFDVPMVAVSLVDDDRQWFKASVGLDAREGARADAFCSSTIQGSGAFVVTDALTDDRFSDNPAVHDKPSIRFYAGQPLEAPGGQRVGALCILDTEPRELSAAENDLLRDLANWVQEELASDEELERANQVQRSLLPKIAPVVPGYDIAGRCLPAREVAGDFFDYFMVGDDLQVSIADVMGKGIAAAIIAASVRAVLRGATRFIGVTEAINRVAIDLAPDLADTSTFVTLFSARLEPAGRITYVDAGHGLSEIVSPSGAVRRLTSDGLPLGAVDGSTWLEHTTTIDVGDTFVSVSDGLLDYFDTVGDATAAVARSAVAATSAEDLIDRISNYSMGHRILDDLTAVVIRRIA